MNYEVKQVRLSLGTHTKNMEKATLGCSETHRVSGITGEFWKTKYLEETHFLFSRCPNQEVL